MHSQERERVISFELSRRNHWRDAEINPEVPVAGDETRAICSQESVPGRGGKASG
jgi:hypothetical protein